MNTQILQQTVSRLILAIPLVLMAAVLGCTDAKPQITLENARAELSTKSANEGLVYVTIRNEGGPDAVKDVRTTVPGAITEINSMTKTGLVRTDTMPIAAKSTVELKPEDSTIVIRKLPPDAKAGYQFTVTLVFERSGERTLSLVFKNTEKHSMTEGEGKNMTPRD